MRRRATPTPTPTPTPIAVPFDDEDDDESVGVEEVEGDEVSEAALPSAEAEIGVVLEPASDVAEVVVVIVVLRPGFLESAIQN